MTRKAKNKRRTPPTNDVVSMGSRVVIENIHTKEEAAYTLVAPDSASPSAGKISVHCPLALGLMGHKTGELAAVDLRDGPKTFKILSVGNPKKSVKSGRSIRVSFWT